LGKGRVSTHVVCIPFPGGECPLVPSVGRKGTALLLLFAYGLRPPSVRRCFYPLVKNRFLMGSFVTHTCVCYKSSFRSGYAIRSESHYGRSETKGALVRALKGILPLPSLFLPKGGKGRNKEGKPKLTIPYVVSGLPSGGRKPVNK
jgi:hypothetical protein